MSYDEPKILNLMDALKNSVADGYAKREAKKTCMPVLQPAVDGLPECRCKRIDEIRAVPRMLGIWRCAGCGGEVKP